MKCFFTIKCFRWKTIQPAIQRQFSSDETVAASNQSYDQNRTVHMDANQNPLNGFVSENESITGTGIDPYATTDDENAEAVLCKDSNTHTFLSFQQPM